MWCYPQYAPCSVWQLAGEHRERPWYSVDSQYVSATVWKEARMKQAVWFPLQLTPAGVLWGSDSRQWEVMWAAQSRRFTFVPRAPWSLSRKDYTERMIFLCMQVAQRGNLTPGRKLGNSGLLEGSEKLPRHTFPCPYILSWENRSVLGLQSHICYVCLALCRFPVWQKNLQAAK